MRLHAFHGVMPQEREVGNDYVVNLRIGYPLEDCIMSDDVSDTLSYATAAEIIKKEMDVPSALIEHVAGRIIATLRQRFDRITAITVRIIKIAPPMSFDMDGAGIELEYRSPSLSQKSE